MKTKDKFKKSSGISWYPGHMLKAERELKKKLSLIDLVIEIVDSRAPQSTRNHTLIQLTIKKPRIILLNKCDLSSSKTARLWKNHFLANGERCFLFSKYSERGLKDFSLALKGKILREVRSSLGENAQFRPLRVLVMGMPNVGKSTLINLLSQRNKTCTGPLPGVTRHQQWVQISKNLELLDSPGVMTPRIQSRETGIILSLLAVIKDKIVRNDQIVDYILSKVDLRENSGILDNYAIIEPPSNANQFLAQIAKRRGFLRNEGKIDLERAALCLIKDFRSGSLGKISLESP